MPDETTITTMELATPAVDHSEETVFMPTFMSIKLPAIEVFNLTAFCNLTDRVVATQQRLVLSYLTSGTRIAEWFRSSREASRQEESNNGTREAPEEGSAESDEVDVSDDSIRVRAYALYEQRDRRPGGALDDWNRARAELQATAHHKIAALVP